SQFCDRSAGRGLPPGVIDSAIRRSLAPWAARRRPSEEDTMNEMTQKAGLAGSPFKSRYDNWIGGKFVPPVGGRYMDNVTPITGSVVCEVARSDAADIDLALDAAQAAKEAWGKTAAA